MTPEIFAAGAALLVWVYLLLARGAFWLCSERDDWSSSPVAKWPAVTAIVPARNEAGVIAGSIGSLGRQDYRGSWSIILVDDESSDETVANAQRAVPEGCMLRVVSSRTVATSWTGKLWALKQGIDVALAIEPRPEYLLLTDADIFHPADSVSRLVRHAEGLCLVLTSLMVKLHCKSFAERANVPAFVFFFQMLYPFRWINRPSSSAAAAAGGCMLVRSDALAKAGGIQAIGGALIDDCALARVLKRQGPIWLALTSRVLSMREYPKLADVRAMIARSAYAQLRYSPLLLAATLAGMLLTFVVPVLMALFGSGLSRALGLVTWGIMAAAFQPILRFYQLSPLWGFALPAIALEYLVFTLDSAYAYARGRGGAWKGRMQAKVSES
ncbi:MAG TPA: glycosyltransferase [Xanthobacteraceae bacterium]